MYNDDYSINMSDCDVYHRFMFINDLETENPESFY